MSRYEGDSGLPTRVLARDNHRCRWCGRVGVSLDVHHIRYRRSSKDDCEENLISLCREHHGFVHGAKLNDTTIEKARAQEVLRELVVAPGMTGLALMRQMVKQEQEQEEACTLTSVPPRT